MALQFPSNPITGQLYQSGASSTYRWTGTYWEIVPATVRNIAAAESVLHSPTAELAISTPTVNTTTTASYALSGGSGYDWIDAGTMTVTATTTNPSKASSPLVDFIKYRKDSSTAYQVWYRYAHNNSTGATYGSGVYMVDLPTGLAFGTSVKKAPTLNISSVTPYIIPTEGKIVTNDTLFAKVSVVPFQNGKFYVITQKTTNQNTFWYNSSGAFGSATNFLIDFKFIVETT